MQIADASNSSRVGFLSLLDQPVAPTELVPLKYYTSCAVAPQPKELQNISSKFSKIFLVDR